MLFSYLLSSWPLKERSCWNAQSLVSIIAHHFYISFLEVIINANSYDLRHRCIYISQSIPLTVFALYSKIFRRPIPETSWLFPAFGCGFPHEIFFLKKICLHPLSALLKHPGIFGKYSKMKILVLTFLKKAFFRPSTLKTVIKKN